MSQSKFAAHFNIPVSTLQDWEHNRRKPPSYVVDMIVKILKLENKNNSISENSWISCSDRLPHKYCHCLVTRRNEYEDGFDTDVREDAYMELEGVWDWQSKHEGLIDNIIAWMPLPEPYKSDAQV